MIKIKIAHTGKIENIDYSRFPPDFVIVLMAGPQLHLTLVAI